ncbi:hypothetical protein CR513_51756, partial [Mucuna pruriens]
MILPKRYSIIVQNISLSLHINHPNQLCEACFLDNHARRSFPKEVESRANKHLQLVQTDMCGPIDPPSFALLKKESGYVIKVLNFDKGDAFTSKEFNEFCEKNEIRHPLMVLKTLQQNGVAKRKNRTILNMARCMLKAKSMPKEFWAKVVSCVVYLSNRSPTINVKGRFKLNDRGVKHVFIGYDASSKGYKLYNPKNRKIINLMKKRHGIRRKKKTLMISFHILKKHPIEFSTPPLSPIPSIHEASSSKESSSEREKNEKHSRNI